MWKNVAKCVLKVSMSISISGHVLNGYEWNGEFRNYVSETYQKRVSLRFFLLVNEFRIYDMPFTNPLNLLLLSSLNNGKAAFQTWFGENQINKVT